MVILGPGFFDALFYLIIFLITVDFFVTSIFLLLGKTNTKIPKLLGYHIVDIFDKSEKNYNGRWKSIKFLLGRRAMSIYMLLEGVFMTVYFVSSSSDIIHSIINECITPWINSVNCK
jgi:hypothetical protein